MEDEEFIEQHKLMEYITNFNIHFKLLLKRYKRFKEINKIGNDDIDVTTYLDMIVVQLRAMCIENKRYKNNYTAQNLLCKLGEEELAQDIDNMLDKKFYHGSTKVNIRDALKILADKFICHYDNFDGEKQHMLSLADVLMSRLSNPHEDVNLDYIMKVLVNCIGEGLTIEI